MFRPEKPRCDRKQIDLREFDFLVKGRPNKNISIQQTEFFFSKISSVPTLYLELNSLRQRRLDNFSQF
jgi:hypothetical protein